MPSATTPGTADATNHPGTTASAILVVLVLAMAAFLVIVVLAFGTEKAPASITGRTATSSQHIE